METAQNKMTKETLGQLIIDSEETMYHIAKSLLYNDADCADAIQEAIVKAFSKYGSLKEDRFAKSWLIRILINECYNILRREQKKVSIEEVPMEPVVHTEEKDYSELYRAVRELKEELKIPVILFYMEGFRVREIAQILDISEGAVQKRLVRARDILKRTIDREEISA